MFQKNFAGKILECHLNLLNVIRVGGYLPDRVTNLILQYLTNRWSNSFPWKLDSSLSTFVYRTIIGTCMCVCVYVCPFFRLVI